MTGADRRHVAEGAILALIGLSVLLLVPSQVRVIRGVGTAMSPSFLPSLIGIALIVVGISSVVLSIVARNKEKPFELRREELLRVGAAVLLLVAYSLLFHRIGFVVTSAIFYGIFSFLFGATSVPKTVIGMIAVPVVVWFFFEIVFVIPMPHGIAF